MDWRFNTIWFEQLNQETLVEIDYKEKSFDNNVDVKKIEYANIWHLNEKNNSLENLKEFENLLFLSLNSSNVRNMQVVENFKNLKRLELHYCVKLENDFGIINNESSLEFLHINMSKKFVFSDELLKLKNLKVLCLNDCAEIENLDFLKNFPKLIDFRFVDTKIKNGNLDILLEHPTLKSVGFIDKKNYNYKCNEINQQLKSRFKENYMTYVQKGEYETFRYNFD